MELSGSTPEPDGTTASTGIWWMVRPGLYGPSSFRIASAFCLTSFASAGFVGPRLENVVKAGLYAGEVADGRSWKEREGGKPCAGSDAPTTVPLRTISLPFALCDAVSCAIPVITAGYAKPSR